MLVFLSFSASSESIKEGETSDISDVKKQLGLYFLNISFSKSEIDDT